MRELIVATRNRGKMREIQELLKDLDLKVTCLLDHHDLPEIEEDGETFRQNAVKKALVIGRHTGKLVLGEDSGLEVAALENRPGIYSARFAGPQATDQTNNAKLLRLLSGIPLEKRAARYRCLAALAQGDNILAVFSGTCRGLIALKPRGQNGFGYDPLFFVPRYQKTFGELAPSIKARISHRARALSRLRDFLLDNLS